LFRAIRPAPAAFGGRGSSRVYLDPLAQGPRTRWTEGRVHYGPTAVPQHGRPPLGVGWLRVKGPTADVGLRTRVLDPPQRSPPTAGRGSRWRGRNEGRFRDSQRRLAKVQWSSRPVARVPREAAGAWRALQWWLAGAVPTPAGPPVGLPGSPRREWGRRRGAIPAALRSLGPRPLAPDPPRLLVVRDQDRPGRVSGQVRQAWARRKEQKPPNPPQLRVRDDALKAKLVKV
jgi:hypothetical protein